MPELKIRDVEAENEQTGSRTLLIATGAYLLFAVAGLSAVGTFPAATQSEDQLVAWFREKAEAVRLFVWAWTVAIPPLAIMVASLRRLLPAHCIAMFFLIGAISYLVAIEIRNMVMGGSGASCGRPEPRKRSRGARCCDLPWAGTDRIDNYHDGSGDLVGVASASPNPSLARAFRTVAFLEQAIETITIFGSSGFTQPGGAMIMQLGATLTLGWLVAFGFWGGLGGHAMKPGEPQAI